MSYESSAEPIKVGYLMDFKLPEFYPQELRGDLTQPFDLVFGQGLARKLARAFSSLDAKSAMLALFALRRRQPQRRRPYRALGHPWVPALYVAASCAIAGAMLAGRPRECAVGLACLATGLPFYWLFSRRRA